jgi:hypothetical protein
VQQRHVALWPQLQAKSKPTKVFSPKFIHLDEWGCIKAKPLEYVALCLDRITQAELFRVPAVQPLCTAIGLIQAALSRSLHLVR